MYKFVIGALGLAFAGFMALMLTQVQTALPDGMTPIVFGAVAGFVLIVIIWALRDDEPQPVEQSVR